MKTCKEVWRRLLRDAEPEPVAVDERQLSERDLVRRWVRTSAQLRHPGTTSEAALDLVEARARIIDELERRDPQGYAAHLPRIDLPTDGPPEEQA